MDEEKNLLSMWLAAEHLEDIDKVDLNTFLYKDIVLMIKKGFSMIEISKKCDLISYGEMIDLVSFRSETFYNMALSYILRKDLQIKLVEVGSKSLAEIDTNKIQTLLDHINASDKLCEEDKNLAEKYFMEMDARSSKEKVKWYRMPTLQKMTGGIYQKELTVIAGRPSTGKSAFALQIALGIAGSKRKVLYFPLEMSTNQMLDRVLFFNGLATNEEAKSGKMDPEKLGKATDFIDKIDNEGFLKFYEGKNSINQIESAIIKEKPFAVVVDQLSKVKPDRKCASIREQFSIITDQLKILAMRENVAVILLCQINRDADNEIPTMANLKESGSIEEDADNVILLHRFKEGELDEVSEAIDWNHTRPMRIELGKQRNGETGAFKMKFRPDKLMFYEEEISSSKVKSE